MPQPAPTDAALAMLSVRVSTFDKQLWASWLDVDVVDVDVADEQKRARGQQGRSNPRFAALNTGCASFESHYQEKRKGKASRVP